MTSKGCMILRFCCFVCLLVLGVSTVGEFFGTCIKRDSVLSHSRKKLSSLAGFV